MTVKANTVQSLEMRGSARGNVSAPEKSITPLRGESCKYRLLKSLTSTILHSLLSNIQQIYGMELTYHAFQAEKRWLTDRRRAFYVPVSVRAD